MKSTTDTLIEAMQILSREIHSDDGIANAAILEASERLKEQDKRIAELEEELLKSTAWGVYHLTSEELKIRDLEQQAKGLTDYAKNNCSGIDAVWLIAAASKLREQAKGGDL